MAYLFTHFTSGKGGDRESIWFSVSHDGLHWTDLGGDIPLLTTDKGTKGIRDPFIVYDEKLGKYFIIATDLLAIGNDWYHYTHKGSRSIFVWESEDLVSWSEERLIEVGIPEAGNVWAPEAVWCEEEGAWFVFFASNVKEKPFEGRKQRIYGTFTRDFCEFTPTFKYIDAKNDVIDTTIICAEGYYYRFSKDETHKKIIIERAKTLLGEYEPVYSETFENYFGLEGPEIYYLEDRQQWCLIADRYHGNKGYVPFVADKLGGDFKELPEGEYDMGKRKKRHGGVISISDEDYERLVESLGVSE